MKRKRCGRPVVSAVLAVADAERAVMSRAGILPRETTGEEVVPGLVGVSRHQCLPSRNAGTGPSRAGSTWTAHGRPLSISAPNGPADDPRLRYSPLGALIVHPSLGLATSIYLANTYNIVWPSPLVEQALPIARPIGAPSVL